MNFLPIASLLGGWMLDRLLGDPLWLPHPVVGFGRMIALAERRLNRGCHRLLRGAVVSVLFVVLTFLLALLVRHLLASIPSPRASGLSLFLFDTVVIFFCLAGTTLVREVRQVFCAVARSLDEGRRQVSRIVGRDCDRLSAQEVRTAALETLAENLSDGVVAPLFWLMLLGTPGMLAYKMVNTLDSMIGYRTERYKDFGCWAARIDDVANYLPARITAILMLLAAWIIERHRSLPAMIRWTWRNGHRHASPNSGYPEAALACILDCRFGGPHNYFGETVDKPYIGETDRPLGADDLQRAVTVCRTAEACMLMLLISLLL